ncbi:MAG: hypothetical protein RMM06_05790 [Armatimonadota bacterium]|nr:hypothetical protein [Armatimonadota bacterium]
MRPVMFAICCGVLTCALAQTSQPNLPVKELVVFKDGHAYVIHEGEVPTDERGNVLLEYVPTPLLGTFWAYSQSPQATLKAVVAATRRVNVKRTALSLRELLEANVGARAAITEVNGEKYTGTILAVPTRLPEELQATALPDTGDKLPQRGNIILIKTEDGTRATPIDRIQYVTFLETCNTSVVETELRNLLTLRLSWGNRQPSKTARVGMLYVQRGVGWIPQYRLVLDGRGRAQLFLQAAIVNELTAFDNARVNLVIGVPSFAYRGTVDPIALQQTIAQLSPHLQPETRRALSGAMMAVAPEADAAGAGSVPEVTGAAAREDLFVFTVEGVSLRKGERMTLPVATYTLDYRDVYTLHIPPDVAPPVSPLEAHQQEVAADLTTPKVTHRIRLKNTTAHPFTTAPILLLAGDTLLRQDRITYTPRGSEVDIPIGTAVNISVQRKDRELRRTAGAATLGGVDYVLVQMEGTLTLTNYTDKTVDLEVTRVIHGEVESVSPQAEVTRTGGASGSAVPVAPALNPTSQIVWKLSLPAGQNAQLTCQWKYYTR